MTDVLQRNLQHDFLRQAALSGSADEGPWLCPLERQRFAPVPLPLHLAREFRDEHSDVSPPG